MEVPGERGARGGVRSQCLRFEADAVTRTPGGFQGAEAFRMYRLFARVCASAVATVALNALVVTGAGASDAGSVAVYPGAISPVEIVTGPDGALWFTDDTGNFDGIGRITPAGEFKIYTSAHIFGPEGITAGPDGALWFTNRGNGSIGRITTSGNITYYPLSARVTPYWITAGRDGALWF